MRTRIHNSRWAATVSLSLLAGLAAPAVHADEGTPPPPIPRTMGLAYYTSMVNDSLPSFDSSMLTVAPGPDWMAGMTVQSVASAMLDSPPGTIVSSGSTVMGYDPPDGPRRIRVDFSEGYIRYTNRLRSFHASSPCTAVPASVAEYALTATAGALGVPTSEWGARQVDIVMDRMVEGEGETPSETTCEVERMVTMTRKAANGLPIFGSRVRETTSNLGERARLLVEWPRFILDTGFMMRTRTEVVEELGRRIWEAESDESGLGAEIDLEILLGYELSEEGYTPVARAVFADIYDRHAAVALYEPLAYNPASGLDSPQTLAAVADLRARFDPVGEAALLEFFLPRNGAIRLTVADVSGREIAALTEDMYEAGWHQRAWDLRNKGGVRVPSGVYFARLEMAGTRATQKLLIVR